jgi:signal transduction histidine kinase
MDAGGSGQPTPRAGSEVGAWRERALRSVLTSTLLLGGMTAVTVFVTAAVTDARVLRQPAFITMLAAFATLVPVRFVKPLPYAARALGLELALGATAWAAFQFAGPQPGPALLMSVVVVSGALFLGRRGLALALPSTTALVTLAALGSLAPAQALRTTAAYFSAAGVMGLLVLHAVRQIEAALRSTREALEHLRVESAERQKAIEELDTTRRALEDAQRLEAIGRLAGGVAHDFNNMLQVILTWTETLETAGLPPKQVRGVTAIRHAAEQAAALTRELLAFSRREVLKVGALRLDAVVSSLAPSIRRLLPEDIEIRIESEPVPAILADEARLNHAILNLAINARDAMRSGGTLTLRLRSLSRDATPEELRARHPSWVLLEVSDTGEGMDEQTRARVFEPFFTTKPGKGTGLGLASVWGIVAQSDGHLSVESTPGAGSVFRAYFPAGSGGETRPAAVEPAAPPPLTQATVLVAEDQESVRRALVEAIERAGMVALPAADADEALRLARSSEGIDVLCTDAVMPGRPTHVMIEELRRLHPRCQVLLCTGYVEEELIRRQIRTGAYAHLAKPVSSAELVERIRILLADGSSASRVS